MSFGGLSKSFGENASRDVSTECIKQLTKISQHPGNLREPETSEHTSQKFKNTLQIETSSFQQAKSKSQDEENPLKLWQVPFKSYGTYHRVQKRHSRRAPYELQRTKLNRLQRNGINPYYATSKFEPFYQEEINPWRPKVFNEANEDFESFRDEVSDHIDPCFLAHENKSSILE